MTGQGKKETTNPKSRSFNKRGKKQRLRSSNREERRPHFSVPVAEWASPLEKVQAASLWGTQAALRIGQCSQTDLDLNSSSDVCLILGKILHDSGPWFPYLENNANFAWSCEGCIR